MTFEKKEQQKRKIRGKKLQHMGNCFTSPVKSLTPAASTRPSSPGTTTGSVTATTGKLSTNRGSTFGQSTDSSSENNSSEVCGQILETPNLRVYTFAELRSATKNFNPDTVLGEGGFGRVYKGWVDEKTLNPTKSGLGMVIAVKKLNQDSVQGLEQWQSEVNFLGRISHPNLVKLLGYCLEDKELLLVYEFMARGCLENHFFRRGGGGGGGGGMQPFSWSLRLKIVLGAARGLAFLHSSEKQVIYRDFKASNILLDSNYNAKLSDFGLAKNGPTGGDSHVTTRVMGTYGYAAPEYVATGHLYVKSDVYGFGVVLLEMLSGQRALDLKRPMEKQNLVNWAKPFLLDRKKFSRIMDPQLDGDYPLKGALLAAQLTLKCLAGNPKDRPSMNEVVETLENVEAMSKPKESKDKSQHALSLSRGKGRAHGSPVHPRRDANGPAAQPGHQKSRIR